MAVALGTGSLFAEAHASAVPPLISGTGNIVGTDANRCLVAFLTFSSVVPTGISVILDPTGVNQALTKIAGPIANSNNTTEVLIFALLAPSAVTSKVLSVSWTGGSVTASIAGHCWVGADQGTVAATVGGIVSSTGTGTAVSLAIPTASGNATVNLASDNPAVGTLSAPTQTQIFLTNALTDNGGSYALSVGASDTHAWTISPSTQWVSLGAVIYAVGQAPSTDTLFAQASL